MNLIDLKQAPIVEKAQEGATLFALNADGTVERISAENVGGSGAKVAKMTVDLSGLYGEQSAAVSLQNLKDGVSTLASSSTVTIAAECGNMTFEEAVAIIKAGEKLDIMVTGDLSVWAEGALGTGYATEVWYVPATGTNEEKSGVGSTPEQIAFWTPSYGQTAMWTWTADGITATMG